MGATVLDELGAFFIIRYFHKDNVPWYNCFMGIELWIYVYYYSFILQNKRLLAFIRIFLWVFPVFWFVVVFIVFGLYKWNSYVAVMECIMTVFLSLCFYYQLLTAKKLAVLKTCPEFWIATGLVICYSCNLPFIGMFQFLTQNFRVLTTKLVGMIQILNILMYSMFTYAFLCRINTRKL